MKLPKLFVWIICLGLISSCSNVPDKVAQSNGPKIPVETDNTQLSAAQEELLKLAEIDSTQAIQYIHQGFFEKAQPLAEIALKIRTEILGEKHPNTLISMTNLAVIYRDLGRLSDALPLFEKSYRFRAEVLRKKHSDTLISLMALAGIYNKLGRLSDALPLYEKIYSLSEELEVEKYLTGEKVLTVTIENKDDFDLAKSSFIWKNLLISSTFDIMDNLVIIYQKLGQFSEALPLAEKNYRLSKEVSGEKKLDTIMRQNSLVVLYLELERSSEALSLAEENYRLSKEVLGEKKPNTIAIMMNLAEAYKKIGRLSDALSLLEKGYSLSKEVLGEKHSITRRILNRLTDLYDK
ncbi:tetratricopeptide repeat protein [Candidatus Parabeggiatoa sp. HSG14]|uniref:tetratricopeptide repeat protein n=1 Tax=Candidatus Parabeggiatoa sp. HSG14 TaxID=3055593 RepID=UPI0025A75539|nr:tetratricopeptide repeat protein [Thiotrichales bacterium HSG14]